MHPLTRGLPPSPCTHPSVATPAVCRRVLDKYCIGELSTARQPSKGEPVYLAGASSDEFYVTLKQRVEKYFKQNKVACCCCLLLSFALLYMCMQRGPLALGARQRSAPFCAGR